MKFEKNNFSKINCIDCNEFLAESVVSYFRKIDLNFFGHFNFLNDGRFWFNSNQKVCSKVYAPQLKKIDWLWSNELQEGVSFPYFSGQTPILLDATSTLINPMVITRRHKKSSEIFIFDIKIDKPYDVYVNQFRLFENFLHHHKEESKKIISHVNKFCAVTCNKKSLIFKEHPLDSGVNPKKFCLYHSGKELFVSSKEYSCLELLAHGYSLSSIATQLNLSIRTIETYIDRIKKKLNVGQRDELVSVYWSNKILRN